MSKNRTHRHGRVLCVSGAEGQSATAWQTRRSLRGAAAAPSSAPLLMKQDDLACGPQCEQFERNPTTVCATVVVGLISSPFCCASSLRSWESLRPSRMRRVRSMPTAAIFPPVITGGSARSLERSSSECFSCSEFHGSEYSGRGSGSQKCSKVLIQDGFPGGEIPSRLILYQSVVRFSPSRAAAPRGPPICQFAL